MYDNLLANVPTDLYVGGKWRKSSDGQRFPARLLSDGPRFRGGSHADNPLHLFLVGNPAA